MPVGPKKLAMSIKYNKAHAEEHIDALQKAKKKLAKAGVKMAKKYPSLSEMK